MNELLITSLLGIAVLAADILRLRKFIPALVILGLSALIGVSIMDWGKNNNPFGHSMLIFDNFALGFTIVLSFITLCWLLLTADHFGTENKRTDLYALALFSLTGAIIMTAYTNMVMLFLGIEILSIPLYVLAASDRKNILSNEAGFKYFFLGSVASSVLLFGVALIYGASGTFNIHELMEFCQSSPTQNTMVTVGMTLILAGFAFKISVAPFHFWAPDVYQGAPTPVTAFMATVVKGAAFAGLYRLFDLGLLPYVQTFHVAISAMVILTLIMANTIGSIQTNVKRLMAYSSVSHAAFMLAAVMVAGSSHPKYLLYYVLTYSIASLTAFVVLYQVSKIQGGAEDTDAFKGLVKRNPVMASALTLALFSMAGIPPLAGFMAKYFVIADVVAQGFTAVAVVMVLASVVAMYYYLRIIMAVFTPLENAGRIVLTSAQHFVFVLFTLLMVALFFLSSLTEIVHW
jgi:NADH-quinone oxidoreductase subunit N